MKFIQEKKEIVYNLAIKEITNNFNYIKEQAKGEKLYAFGLGLVDDFFAGFRCAGNTIESLKNIIKDKSIQECVGYFWSLDEWEYSGKYNPEYSSYDLLYSIVQTTSDEEEYNNIRKEYENILINALLHCDKNGVFGKGTEREELIIYVHYADDYADDVISNYSAKLLNSNKIYQLFEKRYNQNKNNLTQVIFNKIKNVA